MKRPEPQRKAYLKRSTKPIKRSGPIPSRSRKVKTKPTNRCRPYLDWLKTQPCAVTKCLTGEWYSWHPSSGSRTVYHPFLIYVDPAHVKTRGSGGGDLWNALPLSRVMHDLQHQIGWPAFEAKFGLDARGLAREHTERWLRTEAGLAWQAEHG